jgi:hypothetical protein
MVIPTSAKQWLDHADYSCVQCLGTHVSRYLNTNVMVLPLAITTVPILDYPLVLRGVHRLHMQLWA